MEPYNWGLKFSCMNYIGKTIASFREKWGIEQKDLAKAIGVSKGYISLIESGNRQPNTKLLTKIADYFEVPLYSFLFEAAKDAGAYKSKKAKETLQSIDPIIRKLLDALLSGSKVKSSDTPLPTKKAIKRKSGVRKKN